MGGTGGFWGWVEFDRSADGTQTWGDVEAAFCFHTDDLRDNKIAALRAYIPMDLFAQQLG
jgi:hypothetical protein